MENLTGYVFLLCLFGFPNVFGIYDGKITTIEKHPYLVAVDCSVDFVCPGVIIGKYWVLLTADCINGFEASDVQVLTGSGEMFSGDSYQASERHVHPDYSSGSYDYNYALIKVDSEIAFSKTVKAARLPKTSARAGTALTVLGWGGPKTDEKLRKGIMKVMSNKECETYQSTTFTSRMGCLYKKRGATACYNDYGDPVTKGDVLYYLVSSVSDSCDSSAGPIITASVYPALSWIKNITGI